MENFASTGNTPIDNLVKNSSSEDSVVFIPPKDVSEENFNKALADAVEEGKKIKKRKNRKRNKSPEPSNKLSSENDESMEAARGKKSKAASEVDVSTSGSDATTHVSETKSDLNSQIPDGNFIKFAFLYKLILGKMASNTSSFFEERIWDPKYDKTWSNHSQKDSISHENLGKIFYKLLTIY